MAVDLLRQGHLHAHKHSGPNNGMEADDLLTHEVDICRPILGIIVVLVIEESQSGGIVKQGIYPNVNNMTGIKVHRYTPSKAGTGHTQILQAGINEIIDHFIDTAPRL